MLDAEEKAEYLKLLQNRELLLDSADAAHSLPAFARGAWQVVEPATEMHWNWHLDLICEWLQLVREQKVRRIVFNVPPQTMKSRLITVFFPCWTWATIAARRFLTCSYSHDLSVEHSIERRFIIQSQWFQTMFPKRAMMSPAQNRQDIFRNTAGGRMTATSTGGTATGRGAHAVIIDDPQNPETAESEVERKKANGFFDGTLSTRLSDRINGVFVIVMQRLHTNDLTGHVMQKPVEHGAQPWTVISLPMMADQDEEWVGPVTGRVWKRKAGELLWPVRFPLVSVKELASDLGPYRAAGQLQQRPTPKGGVIIKEDWLRFWNYTGLGCRALPTKFDEVMQSWDMNFKQTTDGSFVVGQVWGKLKADKFLLWEVRGRWSFNDALSQIRKLCEHFVIAKRKLVENKANGPAVVSSLNSEIGGFVEVEPEGSKEARMYAVSPEYAAGNIFIPDPTMPRFAWSEEHLNEVCRYPQEPNDRGDAAAQAINFWRSNRDDMFEWLKKEAAKAQQVVDAARAGIVPRASR